LIERPLRVCAFSFGLKEPPPCMGQAACELDAACA